MNKDTYDIYREKLEQIIAEQGGEYVADDALQQFTLYMRDNWSVSDLKLYRYSPADYFNIRNFETGTLRLTNIGVLNDIYEGLPQDLHGELDERLVCELKDVAQIKSFSETPLSTVMWSHYAQEHKGFCVEYDISELDHTDPILEHLFPVAYLEKRCFQTDVENLVEELRNLRTNIKDRNVHDYEGYLTDLMALFLVKGQEWESEREWRIIYTLLQIYEEDTEDLYNSLMSFECATGIYLGYRTHPEIRKNICEIVGRKNKLRTQNGRTGIKVYQMRLSADRYGLIPEEIHI